MTRLRVFHAIVSAMVGVAVPVATFLINGDVAMEIFVLGAVIGFAYWYWGPTWPPL